MTSDGRPEFRLWIDRQPEPNFVRLPLTHVTKGLLAKDIVREGRITPTPCDALGEALAFFFYGRPAYRVHGDGAIKTPATCPFLFLFRAELMDRAHSIHAFDTGAFAARLYKHVLMDEMTIKDFSLQQDSTRPNKLIAATFSTLEAYLDGDTSEIPDPGTAVPADEFLARAYIELLRSPGRNEPDDRVGTIEVTIRDPLPLSSMLQAVVVPDILWNDQFKSEWLGELSAQGVSVVPFPFKPGRAPDYYLALMEIAVKNYYIESDILG